MSFPRQTCGRHEHKSLPCRPRGRVPLTELPLGADKALRDLSGKAQEASVSLDSTIQQHREDGTAPAQRRRGTTSPLQLSAQRGVQPAHRAAFVLQQLRPRSIALHAL
jgi:hypothetical protein